MRQLEYPTFVKYPGPWLIALSELEDLDRILDEEWKRLNEYKESMVREMVEKELEDVPEEDRDGVRAEEELNARSSLRHYNEGKKVRAVFKSGKRLTAHSFKEMARDQNIRDDLPKDLSVSMDCGKVSVSLEMDDYGTRNLALKVEPSSSSVATEVFSVLERWVVSVSAPLWQRLWLKFQGLQWVVLFPLLLFLAMGLLLSIADPEIKYRHAIRPEVRELLKDGISEEEISRAVEIILAFQTKTYPEVLPVAYSRRMKVFALISGILLVLASVLSLGPTFHLGIGLGEKRLKWWRIYLKFLAITLPGIIVTGLILPFIYDKIF